MKKLTPLVLLLALFACDQSELYIEPGEDQSVAIIEVPDATSLDQVFNVVEVQPSYPGGQEAWMKYLKTTLKYPQQAKQKGIQGAVFISFVVDKSGELRDMQVIKGVGHGCDEEALRVLMESKKWNPGVQSGQAVSARMQFRIVFKLPEGAEGPASLNVGETETVKQSDSE